MQDERDIVVFTDDEGNDFELEVMDYFFYNGQEYAVLSDADAHFNPRAPCGARRQKGTKITVHFCENRLDLRFSTGSAACQEQNRS